MGHAIRVIAPNQTELITTVNTVRRTIFFSYDPPVIVKYDYNHGVPKEYKREKYSEIFVTNKKHSATTSRHINKMSASYQGPKNLAQYVSQGEIYRLSHIMNTREE